MAEKLKDNSQDRKYFTQVCNLVDDLDLSPVAIALYLHYKRWSAAENRKSPGVKELMKKFKCSDRTIKAAKLELVKHRLIRIKTFDAKLAKADEVTICDIWERNIKHFQEVKPAPVANERQVEEKVADPSSESDSPVVEERQPPSSESDTRERNLEKENMKESEGDPPASDFGEPRNVPPAKFHHPALKAIRELTKHNPPKAIWDDLIDILTDSPDLDLLKACHKAWLFKGNKETNLAWVNEWYVQGGPPAYGSGFSKAKPFDPGTVKPSDPDDDSECKTCQDFGYNIIHNGPSINDAEKVPCPDCQQVEAAA